MTPSAPPTGGAGLYAPFGVQTFVPESWLTGWTLCFGDDYDDAAYPNITAVLAGPCRGSLLLLACRATGVQYLTVLACAPRGDVLFDTGDSNTPHDANGVGWYFSDNLSMGFAPEGERIDRNTCDEGVEAYYANRTGLQQDRMCWHTGAGNGAAPGELAPGWSCGAQTYLQDDPGAYQRLIYMNDATQLYSPSTTMSGSVSASTTVSASSSASMSSSATSTASLSVGASPSITPSPTGTTTLTGTMTPTSTSSAP